MCEIKVFIEDKDICPDIIAITETWLNTDIPSSMFIDLNMFWCFRKDRSTRGGGVCLLVKRSLNCVVTEVNIPQAFSALELLAVDISTNSDVLPLRMIVAYRPPDYDSDRNELMVSALDWLSAASARVCVLGRVDTTN